MLVQYNKVEVCRKELIVLKEVDFKLYAGEFVYFIGRVGTGKSSLLKTMYADIPILEGGLYLLDYLRTNKFEQADDTAFIRERADRAAETYERARLEGYPADGAQELAMDTLLRGLHYSRYAILREVVENEFADEVPEEKREAFVLKLLPLVGNVFSVYDLSDDNFALSSDYDLLYTELTGATVLYLDEYGV